MFGIITYSSFFRSQEDSLIVLLSHRRENEQIMAFRPFPLSTKKKGVSSSRPILRFVSEFFPRPKGANFLFGLCLLHLLGEICAL